PGQPPYGNKDTLQTHALAHQQMALDDDGNPLPNLLIIDGISSNVGHEGIDLEQLRKMYAALLQVATEHLDRLQIIVTDNDSPPSMASTEHSNSQTPTDSCPEYLQLPATTAPPPPTRALMPQDELRNHKAFRLRRARHAQNAYIAER
ncbi:hypothetical protein GTZ78_19840, partial [Streptomyces sp. SID8361]|uniref:hypothetical protein n=1 Tax=Streptomyces sp. MnatMP-M27 TaxID=1839768 RepID=UPI00144DD768